MRFPVTIERITDSAVTTAKVGPAAVTTAKIGPSAVESSEINDGTVTASDLASTLDLSSKTVTLPGSATATIDQNIALLGFKMAVNDGLTVFNLVDGVVDEFHDESGTDEGEGSNDLYNCSSDFYVNSTSPTGAPFTGPFSAGFSTTTITEPDTSTAGTNPAVSTGTFGTFTVPTGTTSVNIYAWGSGGAGSRPQPGNGPHCGVGGGGGFAEGTAAVTGGQALRVAVGEGGHTYVHIGSYPGVLTRAMGGGGTAEPGGSGSPQQRAGTGGGLSGVFSSPVPATIDSGTKSVNGTAPTAYVVAGAGGGIGHPGGIGGDGGGLTGLRADEVASTDQESGDGGGGDQEQGGQGGAVTSGTIGQTGGLFYGGDSSDDANAGGGGSGYYGGGGGGLGVGPDERRGGGGSSFYGHPQVTSGATTAGANSEVGNSSSPLYTADTGEGGNFGDPSSTCTPLPSIAGEDGFVLLTGCQSVSASATSTTIVSNAFTSTSVATTSRIVVFEENVDTPTLNTDIIASISRDGGSTFTTATLSDSGYVTGSSGQRILTGTATISGQPSGQSMRWKLALANNAVKIHGVALQWS